jgi:hypothetical protein
MRVWVLAIALSATAIMAPAQAGAEHTFVRLVCFGQAPVNAVATIEIDGVPLEVRCSDGQRVAEVSVTPHNLSWVLHLEMNTPLGKRTVMRQGTEWPLTLSTELDNRECQLDLH